MPELPDLTVVAEELTRRIAGRPVLAATAPMPILVRATPEALSALEGARVGSATRRGKFLLLPLEREGEADRAGDRRIHPTRPPPPDSKGSGRSRV